MTTHHYYLNQKNFASANKLVNISSEALKILDQYGYWMEALYLGKIEPTTGDQFKFVDSCKTRTNCTTIYEKAYLEYLIEQDRNEELAYKNILAFRKEIANFRILVEHCSDEELSRLISRP